MSAEPPSPAVTAAAAPILLPYRRDPVAALAKLVIDRYRAALPDLSRCAVLLPQLLDAPRLRRCLLDEAFALGHRALLGPSILTLRGWLAEVAPPPAPPFSHQAQELMLVETLNRHRGLFGGGDPWLLAGDLLELFSQLTLHRVALPAELDAFVKRLGDAYRLGARTSPALSAEANLIHTLWHAWHRQVRDEGRLDPQVGYIAQLDDSLAAVDPDTHIFLAGYAVLAPPERRWASALAQRGQLTELLQGNDPADPVTDPYTEFLDAVFAGLRGDHDNAPFKERARAYATHHPASPAARCLFAYEAPHAEAEARAVDIQVRRWLLQGKRRIAVVTDDRRLARRVRALLERADIALHDAGGWALSTAAAAAALERWLETLEEDFAYQALTDLLKSPFAFPRRDRGELLSAVYRFEQDLVLHENIPRNLRRYRRHLAYRRERWPPAAGETVQALLDDVEHAAEPLLPLLRDERAHAPRRYLDALEESLRRLGLAESFAQDAAGERILQELRAMREGLAGRSIRMRWREFRTWLGRTLERYNFWTPAAASPVRLVGLENGAPAGYDALLVAGAAAQHLPGAGEPSPFFNDAVRRELGLPDYRRRLDARFHHFRCLLQAAPQVLITAHREENGEPLSASPWLEALQSFHRFAYGTPLSDGGLADLVDRPSAQVTRGDDAAPPVPKTMPAPRIVPSLLPDKLSADAYQQLMDCPYQFFAARALKLSAPETVREALEKSDFGQRVHLALHAFHSGADGYPGPFREPLTAANRGAAVRCLEDISLAVFAKDLEDNFMHRGWLRRWRRIIPEYIDWQIERERFWRVADSEVAVEIPYQGLTLRGRIDRLDHGAAGDAIVDYKTGTVPHADDVLSGEAVQLPFYALLAGAAARRAEYLSLNGDRFGSHAALEGEILRDLAAQNGTRLRTAMTDLAGGAPAPAWGDDRVCRFCAMAGLCRRAVWLETTSANLPEV